jgi:uncharacterized protein YeaO (DUF488 family)
MNISIHRIYDQTAQPLGDRVRVDRVWPRGVTKKRAPLDGWLKELAPSTTLRQWFGHHPARWGEFNKRYRMELALHPEELDRLRQIAHDGHLVLLYGAKDTEHNQAVVIRDALLAGPF